MDSRSRFIHIRKTWTLLRRHFSSPAVSFKCSSLEVIQAQESERNPKPDPNHLLFGHHFSDHMLEIEYTSSSGWGIPKISPVHNLVIHPAAKVLHYAQEAFEGMKAYRGVDNKIRLFRPDLNMKRFLMSAERSSLPMFDGTELLECVKKLVAIDHSWVPQSTTSSLYIRPTFIGTEGTLGISSTNRALLYVLTGPVGPYFATGVKPVALLADPQFCRAWPGGSGNRKLGANYGPTIAVQRHAEKMNLQQVLWLFGDDHRLAEVGAMNIFVFLKNEKGERELLTPPLNGTILPGVTRQSLLDICRNWKEFKVVEREITMKELVTALKENRLLEIFGAGTACVVCPVNRIHYMGQDLDIPTMEYKEPLNIRLLKAITDIQYGKHQPHEWTVEVN